MEQAGRLPASPRQTAAVATGGGRGEPLPVESVVGGGDEAVLPWLVVAAAPFVGALLGGWGGTATAIALLQRTRRSFLAPRPDVEALVAALRRHLW